MAKVAKPLTAIEVGRLEEPGYHAVGTVPGLYLQVTPGGAKSWVMRVKVGAKRREIGLGSYPAVKLAQAHEKARQTREQIAGGVDPIEHKKALLSELMAKQALEFTLLTAARSGEVRGATWAEIDMAAKVWTVPKERMKAGKEHRVPLSDAAIKLLERLPRMAGTELVFPAVRGGELSDATMSQLMRRMGYKDSKGRVCVPHGLRSTFRDWAGERTSYQGDVIEAALAHVRGDKTEAAYFRSDLFEKRRRLMADWAAFVDRVEVSADNVVAIRAGA